MQFNHFLRENRWFFYLLGMFLGLGILWLAFTPKGAMLLWFSDHRTGWANWFFPRITQGGEAAGFVLVLLLLSALKWRWALALIAMTPAVSIVSNLSKQLLRQPRPGRYFREMGMWEQIVPVPGVEVHQGLTSLPSGHTMAAFAFFSLLAFCLPNKRIGAVAAFSIALLVGISRIYLVLHFEEDVLLGAAIGVGLAIFFYALFYPRNPALAGPLDWGWGAWALRKRQQPEIA